jgi:hypothetical protein
VRAAYTALVLGIVGGLGLATLVLPSKADRPTTVAAALALEAGGPIWIDAVPRRWPRWSRRA